MKVKTILKALEGAPDDAVVSFSVRAIKVEAPKGKVATTKKENPKPSIVKKPASKAGKPTAKPLAKRGAFARKTGGKRR